MTHRQRLSLLQVLFVTCTVISPVVSSKVISLNFSVLSVPASVSGSAFIYVFIFIISNFISELHGKKFAKDTTVLGFICQVVSTSLFFLIQILPSVDSNVQASYHLILGSNVVFTASGVVTYLVSQFCNVYLYDLVKRKTNHVSASNIVSMLVSQAVDTVMFLGLSYGICLSWFWNSHSRIQLFVMMLIQYLLRIMIVLIVTPIFKTAVKHSK